jgi:hypothetical protein
MKKIFITIMMLLSISISSNANDIKRTDIEANNYLTTGFVKKSNVKSDSIHFYDMPLNKHILEMKRCFLLDDVQEEMIYELQDSIEKAFSRLNEMTDSISKEQYLDNIMKHWRRNAYISFFATERTDAKKLFRLYWACVNVTMYNKGYVDAAGNYVPAAAGMAYDRAMMKLLEQPQNYYGTVGCRVELTLSGDGWKIVPSRALISALSGNLG